MKNKLLAVITIFILITFVFINNNVFASTSVTFTDRFGSERTVPAFPESEFFDSSNSYAIVTSGTYINALYVATGDGFFYGNNSSVYCSTNCYMVFIVDGYYEVQSTPVPAGQRLCILDELCYFSTGYYSGIDQLEVIVEAGGDFFYQALLTLETIMNKAAEQAMTEITQKILIVIVATAGLIILLIGLKKGLTVLMSGFRH